MFRLGARVVFLLGALVLAAAHSGHELPIYPSYYPQEIQIEAIEPASAAPLLRDGEIHAYVGGEPSFGNTIPGSISYAESLGSYVVVTINPASDLVKAQGSSCPVTSTIVRNLTGRAEGFFVHPYPITPFDADYVYHFDLAEAARRRYSNESAASELSGLTVRTKGDVAERLILPAWRRDSSKWDAAVEEINVRELVASHSFNVDGWFGPPWLKEGWFHAYLVLSVGLTDVSAQHRAASYFQRLAAGQYNGKVEGVNLERELLSLLTNRCDRVVAGYTVRKEYFNSEFSAGIENIAFDSYAGFGSPIFIRTVKLKDFPWNGWLRLGVEGPPAAAWNPIGGFTDETGRLIWSALGDPALLPAPYNASWILNRIADVKSVQDGD